MIESIHTTTDGRQGGAADERIKQQLDAIPTVNGKGLFIDTATYAEYFGETEANVRKRCASGGIRAVKVGKKWRIPVAYLYEQLETEEA